MSLDETNIDQNLGDIVDKFFKMEHKRYHSRFLDILKIASYDVEHACFIYIADLFGITLTGIDYLAVAERLFVTEGSNIKNNYAIFIISIIEYFENVKIIKSAPISFAGCRYFEISPGVCKKYLLHNNTFSYYQE